MISIKKLSGSPRQAWGFRNGRNYPSAELIIGKGSPCDEDMAIEHFRRLGYAGVVLS